MYISKVWVLLITVSKSWIEWLTLSMCFFQKGCVGNVLIDTFSVYMVYSTLLEVPMIVTNKNEEAPWCAQGILQSRSGD